METRVSNPSLKSSLIILASCLVFGIGLCFPWHSLFSNNNQAAFAQTTQAVSESKKVVVQTTKVTKPQAKQKYLCVARKLTKVSHHTHQAKQRVASHTMKAL